VVCFTCRVAVASSYNWRSTTFINKNMACVRI